MGYRRGFKAEAHALASEIRRELHLRELDPLDPYRLVAHLEIPVIPLSDYGEDAPLALHHFSHGEPDAFSAVTVFDGNRRIIVHNDSHVPGRQNSNLCHEAAHGILLHPPTAAIDDRGCRNWGQDVEDEASFLGAALLVSEIACLSIVKYGRDLDASAAHYGVTPKLLLWRLNATGAYKRIRRSRTQHR